MTTSREQDPPRLALRLGEALIDERVRDGVLGDLVEAFHERRARWWFWRQVLLAIVHFPARPHWSHSTGDGVVTGFLEDLYRATRTLKRAPTFTLLCAVTLGVGVGAATAIFSLADPIIIRPLPYESPERAYVAWENDQDRARSNVGFATYADVAAAATGFTSTAAVGTWQPVLNRRGTAEQLVGLRVSWGYFKTIGVRPALGGDFVPTDDAQGHNSVVILSHTLWRTRFGGDSAIVGSFVNVNGTQMRVAGVMPTDYDDVLAPGTQIWRVLGYDVTLPYACRSCRHLRMVARLKPLVTANSALAEVNTIFARLVGENPKDYPGKSFQLVQLQDEATRDVRPPLSVLLAAVALLLVISAVNVSGLQLARALQRNEEFALRAALGAGSGRITRQLLAEGLVLAVVAGLVGLVVAKVGVTQLVGRVPPTVPRLSAVHLDLRALLVATCVTIAAGLAVGLAPAWHVRRRALAGTLRGGRRVGGTPHQLRGALVVTEIAVAVILLAGAGLLTRSLVAVLSVDPGIDIAHVATAQIQVTGSRYADSNAVFAWQDRVLEAARAIPGVERAAFVNQLPLGGNFDSYGVQAEDRPLENPELAPDADRYTVSTDFLGALGIPIIAGRGFEPADNAATGAPVAIVSRSLAQRIWGDESAIGKRVHVGEPTRPWYTVVGVAGDVHHRGLDVGATRQLYVPTHRWFFQDTGIDVVVSASGDPALVLGSLRRAVLEPDPETVITRLTTMANVRAQSTVQRTLALTLFGVFAAVALMLAAAGLFGALAGAVAERGREIGLRSALGATPTDIVGMVLRQGLGLAAAGAALGLLGTLAGAGAMRALLYGVGARDFVTIAGVAFVIAVAAVAASVVPAWRAVRIDPIAALRSE